MVTLEILICTLFKVSINDIYTLSHYQDLRTFKSQSHLSNLYAIIIYLVQSFL